jgi:hypothetical protein
MESNTKYEAGLLRDAIEDRLEMHLCRFFSSSKKKRRQVCGQGGQPRLE